jgi:hypothetical protein
MVAKHMKVEGEEGEGEGGGEGGGGGRGRGGPALPWEPNTHKHTSHNHPHTSKWEISAYCFGARLQAGRYTV